jgi:hypothetical protein
MTITSTQNNTPPVVQFASGSQLDDAATPAAVTITLSFRPRYIRVVNETTRVEAEWFEGMAATKTLKTVANGTRTLDTTSLIAPVTVTSVQSNNDNPTETSQYYSFTILAASMAQNDQIRWQAMA